MHMSKVPLRRLLSKLTALALSTSAVGPAAAGRLREAAQLDASGGPEVPDVPDGDGGADGSTDAADGSTDADDAELDASLMIDREQLDAGDAAAALGRSLALALSEMRPLSATHLLTSWSLSDDALRRLAVAHALAWTFPLVGDALVIDHLSRDTDPAIRAASARAAWARRRTGGDLGVLARLSHDLDPQVRAAAASARTA
jgi:hypothetical protein